MINLYYFFYNTVYIALYVLFDCNHKVKKIYNLIIICLCKGQLILNTKIYSGYLKFLNYEFYFEHLNTFASVQRRFIYSLCVTLKVNIFYHFNKNTNFNSSLLKKSKSKVSKNIILSFFTVEFKAIINECFRITLKRIESKLNALSNFFPFYLFDITSFTSITNNPV